MSFFDKDGNSRHDWNIFLDNFPTIGVFKLRMIRIRRITIKTSPLCSI